MYEVATITEPAALRRDASDVIRDEPWLPYANFDPLAGSEDGVADLQHARWANVSAESPAIVARDDSGRLCAVARVAPRQFESDLFGIRMGRIEPPIAVANPEERLPALRALYAGAVEIAVESGIEHLAIRASTADHCAPWAAQELGAVHVDTQVSWMAELSGEAERSDPPSAASDDPITCEVLDRNDLENLRPSETERLLEWCARGFRNGAALFDVDLPRATARSLYGRWAELALSGAWADAAVIARTSTDIVAFISMQRLDDLSRIAGVEVYGRGLAATVPPHRGMFTKLQRVMISARPLGATYMENETQVSTIGSINVYAKLGFKYLRSTATFHLRTVVD